MTEVKDDALFPGSKLTYGEMRKKVSEEIAERDRAEQDLQRRKIMDIDLPAGNCHCKGQITIRSRVRFIETGEPRFGGPQQGHNQQTLTASCEDCSLVYDVKGKRFAEVRQEIQKMRS